MEQVLVSLLSQVPILAAAESFAALVAAGGATYEDIKANNGNASNIWGRRPKQHHDGARPLLEIAQEPCDLRLHCDVRG